MLLIFSCFVNWTPVVPFLKRALHIISICFFIREVGVRNHTALIKGVLLAFILLALFNLAYRIPDRPISHVDGTGPIYYLGSDNEAISPMLFLFSVSVLFFFAKGVNLLSITGVVLSVFTAFYSKSGTGMMAFAIFAVGSMLLLIPGMRKTIKKRLNSKSILLAIVFYYFIIWGISSSIFPTLGELISRVTGKEAVTFSNRTVIWAEAIKIIEHHPLFGIGYGNGAHGNGVFVNGFYRGAHNMALQWGVNGGIFTIVAFTRALYLVFKKIERYPYIQRFYLYLCVFCYIVAMSMENYSNGLHCLPLLTLLYYTTGPIIRSNEAKQLSMYSRAHLFICSSYI